MSSAIYSDDYRLSQRGRFLVKTNNNMKIIDKHPIAITVMSLGIILSVLFLAISFISQIGVLMAGAPSGLSATVATTSRPVVTTTAGTLFATSTMCAARIISTASSSVMLTFSDYAGQTPTGSFGHFQATSTNVVYDSGQYGCGLVKVWSFATQQVTVTETQ